MDKLTIVPSVSIRVTEHGRTELHLQAQARHMEVSDYIRHLISQDKLLLSREYDPLHQLFGGNTSVASNTASDGGIHE
jgi:hypothetical protein